MPRDLPGAFLCSITFANYKGPFKKYHFKGILSNQQAMYICIGFS